MCANNRITNGFVIAGAAMMLLMSAIAFAQFGSAIGSITEGTATVIRDGVPIDLNSGDVLFEGEQISTGSGVGATIQLAEGGSISLLANSSVAIGGGQIIFDTDSRALFSGLEVPVGVYAGDNLLVSEVTQGTVCEGDYNVIVDTTDTTLNCGVPVWIPLAIAGGITAFALDDDPVHGN